MRIAVIGAGSWGIALAIKSCEANNETILYNRDEGAAAYMTSYRHNPTYLKEVTIPDNLVITDSYEEALTEAEGILLVTPSQFVRDTLVAMKPFLKKDTMVLCCSKGLERSTGMRMDDVLEDELSSITSHIGVLSGPNHAEEIAVNLPAATVVASKNPVTAQAFQEALSTPTFRIYTSSDVAGVELGGTTKNIIALAAGIAYGMELGDNLTATLLTRGLVEMKRFGLAHGAKAETYNGLAGMGDLIATCMSKNSRNRTAGVKLAAGETMQEIIEHSHMVVEGFFAVPAVYEVAKSKGISMPITESLVHVLEGAISPKEALTLLMTRDMKEED